MSVRPRGRSFIVDVKVAAADSATGYTQRVRLTAQTHEAAVTLETRVRDDLRTKGGSTDWARMVLARTTAPSRNLERAIALAWSHPTRGWGLPGCGNGKAYLGHAKAVAEIIGPRRPCSSVRSLDFDRAAAVLAAPGLSTSTVRQKLQALYRVLWFAQQAGWIKARPAWVRPIPAPPRQFTFSTRLEAEVIDYFEVTLGRDDMADLFRLGIDTGARLSELLAIEPADLELGNRYLVIHGPRVTGSRRTKNGEARTVVLVDRAVETLRRRLQAVGRGDRLFPRLNSSRVSVLMRSARANFDRPGNTEFTFHAARHTCGTRMAEAEVPLLMMAEQLGHKTVSMTQRYVKMSPAARRAAILRAMGSGQ